MTLLYLLLAIVAVIVIVFIAFPAKIHVERSIMVNAPVSNVFDQVNDLSEAYDLGITALSLKEIIVESMVVPNRMKLDPKNKDGSDPFLV